MTVQWIPKPPPEGASPVGNSFVSLFASCPHKGYLTHLKPGTDEQGRFTQGLVPKHTADPLLAGDILHKGMEAYYLSGSRDGADTGEYNIEAAVAAIETQWASRHYGWEDEDRAQQYLETMRQCMVNYHMHFGPGGDKPDYPKAKVFHDSNGEPVIEREFWVDLRADESGGLAPIYYTVRVDVLMDENGYLREWQHKSSAPSFVRHKLQTVHVESQMTGTDYVLRSLFPSEACHGVVANVLVKGWTPKSVFAKPAIRELTTRTAEQREAWRRETISTLEDISDYAQRLAQVVASNGDIEEAADWLFPRHGTRNGNCFSFNRRCEFFTLCQERGMEPNFIDRFRPRQTEETFDGNGAA